MMGAKLTLLSIFLMLSAFSFAQNNESPKLAADWVLVDTMYNSFGPAAWELNPIAYEAAANIVGFIHRGSSITSNGELLYNLSTDAGQTWERIAAVNTIISSIGQYPSMALSNPTGGTVSDVTGLFTWAELPGTSFTFGYSHVTPIMNGTVDAYLDSSGYRGAVCWTGGTWFYWSSGGVLFRTEDFVNIEIINVITPPAYMVYLGGVWNNGNVYMGMLGSFEDPDPGNPICSGVYPAYIKSTDDGATWGDVEVIDFRTITGLENYDRLFDYIKDDTYISYAGDINVDKDGFVHLIISVTDTTTNNNTGINALVEVFETAGGWDGRVIYEGIGDIVFTDREGPAVGQMGPSGYLAFDKDGEQMSCVWVADSPTSTLGLCDVYIAWRSIYENDWSAPINLTETDDMNENGSHLAPQLYFDQDHTYAAFVGYFYQLDYFGPDPNFSDRTGFWIAAPTLNTSAVTDNDIQVYDFHLTQNYPNPFNPNTSIQFTVGSDQFVTLKVYDILGNEVATLVNEEKSAGEYKINFDASRLTSSVYVYQLKSEYNIETKKMVLLK